MSRAAARRAAAASASIRADPRDPPRIDPNFLSADADVATLLAGVKVARDIMDGAPLDRHRGAELFAGGNSDSELIERMRRRADTIYHPVGTCRMGHDELAVVDPALGSAASKRSPSWMRR